MSCSGCSTPSFGPGARIFPAVNYRAIGDFNNDGRTDIARVFKVNGLSLNEYAIGLDVNAGDGTMVSTYQDKLTACFAPIAAADFHSSGNLDVVVSVRICDEQGFYIPDAGSVLLYRGDGRGGLAPPVTVVQGIIPGRPGIGDFDGDGLLDIAVGVPNGILIVSGRGDGTFKEPRFIPLGGDHTALVAGDLNNDGRPDLVVGSSSPNAGDPGLLVLLNDGDGKFHVVDEASVDPVYSHSLELADLNGDGFLDVVLADGSPALFTFLNRGDGTLQKPTSIAVESAGGFLAVGDFNGDGRGDVAYDVDSLWVAVYLGGADGKLREICRLPSLGRPLVADFDGDGWDDVVSSGSLYSPFFNATGILYPGNGDGTFESVRRLSIGSPTGLSLVDLNGDGVLDLAWTDNRNNLVGMISRGSGTFSAPVTTAVKDWIEGLVFSDVMGDSRADAVLLTFSPGDSKWHLVTRPGLGDGTFGPETITNLPSSAGGLVVAEFTGDRYKDVVLTFSLPIGWKIQVMPGDGSGSYSLAGPSQDLTALGSGNLLCGDLNGDGIADLVLVNSNNPGRITTLINDGRGVFRVVSILDINFVGAAILDVNGDGRLDLATIRISTATDWILEVRMGDGTGNFLGPISSRVPPDTQFRAADFDGDGHLDFLMGFPATFVKGRGDGSFEPGVSYPLPMSYMSVGDVTGDGKPDVVGTMGDFTWFLPNTTCEPRRLRVEAWRRSCEAAGTPFAQQPAVSVVDDIGNRVSCLTSSPVSASLLPGDEANGAHLLGTPVASLTAGSAKFSDLAVDKGGAGYRIRFDLAGARHAMTPSFSQSLPAPSINGPRDVCAASPSSSFEGPPADWWRWFLDGHQVGLSRVFSPASLGPGRHVISLEAGSDGCASASSLEVTSFAAPCPHRRATPAIGSGHVTPRP